MRGISLRTTAQHEFVAAELRYQDASRDGRMIRSARHKYVVFRGGARAEQLFDLETDPGEVVNLVNDEKARPILERHRAMLDSWMRSTGDAFQKS